MEQVPTYWEPTYPSKPFQRMDITLLVGVASERLIGLAATTVFMSNDRNLTANFAINEYNLVINPSNGGVENGAGIYEHGQQANISADPNFGMIFLNWNGDGISDSNSPNTTVDMTQDRTISASYANGSSVASLFLCPGEIVEDQDAGINTATFSVQLMERVYLDFLSRLLPARMAKRK